MHDDRSDDPTDGPFEERSPLKVSDLGELISLVPYMMGFPPEHSLVVLGLNPREDSDTMSPEPVIRLDLAPDDAHVDERDAQASSVGEQIADVLSRHRIPAAVMVGYGTSDAVVPFGTVVESKLCAAGVGVLEFARVQDGRFWCCCPNPDCGSPEGTVLRTDTSAAAQAVLRGYAPAGSREEVRAMLAPLTGTAGERAGAALAEAAARIAKETEGLGGAARELHCLEQGERLVPEIIGRVRDGAAADSFDEAEIARFLVLLGGHRYVRDLAWGHLDDTELQRSLAFWCEMVRRVGAGDDGDLVPPPACIVAYIALRTGDGALVNLALDQAQEADPQYTMAGLLRRISMHGIGPEDMPLFGSGGIEAAFQRKKTRLREEADATGPSAA